MGRILGIDYGTQRIGLALSDPLHIIASPFQTLVYRGLEECIHSIQGIITDKEVELIVLGLPLGMKNQETEMTKQVRVFAQALEVLKLPIQFLDERLSSISAEKSLIQQQVKTGHNKALIDQRAAAIVLQQYLDTKNR